MFVVIAMEMFLLFSKSLARNSRSFFNFRKFAFEPCACTPIRRKTCESVDRLLPTRLTLEFTFFKNYRYAKCVEFWFSFNKYWKASRDSRPRFFHELITSVLSLTADESLEDFRFKANFERFSDNDFNISSKIILFGLIRIQIAKTRFTTSSPAQFQHLLSKSWIHTKMKWDDQVFFTIHSMFSWSDVTSNINQHKTMSRLCGGWFE